MASFFSIPKEKKRKRVTIAEPPKKRIATKSNGKTSTATPRKTAKLGQKQASRDDDEDSISGSDDDSDLDRANGLEHDVSDSASDHDGETAAEKRLRLAERYLESTRQEVIDDYGFDAAEIDKEILAARLQEDVAESKGKVYKQLAAQLAFDKAAHTLFRSNTQAVTAVATHAPFAYTVTKDMMLIKWRLRDLPQHQFPQATDKHLKTPPTNPHKRPERVRMYRGNRNKVNKKAYMGHTGAILAVACSPDGKYVVTGGADKKIIVYDAETLKPVRVFSNQHRAAVTGLVFRRGTNQMYSCSRDRVVKVWSLDELAYVSSLFGHEEAVVDIDALGQERCVTVGSRDRTARFWKVVDEKQLVFRGGARDRKPVPGLDPKSQAQEGSIDRVAMIDDELFVTGGDSGSLTLWSIQKKNPLFVVPRAHGIEDALAPEVVSAEASPDPKKVVPPPQPRWITALKAVPFSDVILSGSWDGHVRIWKLSEDKKRLEAVGTLGGPLEAPQTSNGVHENGVSETQSTEFEGLSGEDDASGIESQQQEDKHTGREQPWKIKGIINDLSVFERGNRGKNGLCVVAAVGNEHKFGRWMGKIQGVRNGGVVFEVPRIPLTRKVQANGVVGEDEDD